MEQTAIEVKVSITPEDVHLSRKAYHRAKGHGLGFRILSVMSLCMYPVVVLGYIRGVHTLPSWLETLIIFLPIANFIIVPMMIKRTAVKTFEADKAFQEEQMYIFSDDGLRIKAKGATGRLAWREFKDIYEGKDYFLFFTANNLTQIIPKRSFNDPDDVQRLRALFRSKTLMNHDALKQY